MASLSTTALPISASVPGVTFEKKFVSNFRATGSAVHCEPVFSKPESTLAERKLTLLKRCGLFGENTRGAVIERACTFEDLRKAYRLVHDVYIGTGYIRAEPSGVRLRMFETTSDTATFIARVGDRVVGVLSVVGDSLDLGLPSDAAFKSELNALRAAGVRLCELTNQAVADDFRSSAVATELMRCAVAHGVNAGYDRGVATVSPSHNGFYDLLGFHRIGSQRSYSKKLHDPVVALSMDLDRFRRSPEGLNVAEQFIHHFGAAGNPYVAKVGGWAKKARRHFLSPDLLEQLFVNERNFLSECTPAELNILNRRWGQELFTAVNVSRMPENFLVQPLPIPASLPIPTCGAINELRAPGTGTSSRNRATYRSESFRTFRRSPREGELRTVLSHR